MQRKGFWLLSVALMLISWAIAQQEIAIKMRYTPGQTLVYKVALEGTVNVVSEIGVATDLKFKGELTQEQVVKEVAEDGKAVVQVTVTGKMELQNPMEGGQPSPQQVPTTKVLLTILPNGQVMDVKRIREEGEKQPPEAPEMMQDPFQALTVGMGAMSLLPPPLPPKPLKVGETWDLTGTVPVPLPSGQTVPTKVIGQGKFVAVERKDEKELAVTEVQLEVPELGELVSQMLPLKEMGVDVQAKGGTKTSTKNWYDLAQGLLTRSEVSSETKMVLTIAMPANVGGGVMTLQSRTQVQAKVELVEVKKP